MLDAPQIVQAAARSAAVIRLTIPRAEIRNVMGPAIGELLGTLSTQGVAPAGPLFSQHFRMEPGIFDFEVGVPVDGAVMATGRVIPGELPAATVARTTYHGDYEGLGDAWQEFGTWIAGEGHSPAEEMWECHLAGPESNPDPATWRTELNRPLTGVAAS